uniref:Uncharacterized protein n=1 Tax=Glossina palpalis gambiensis TaxID=67801 RepID=A0A1B0BET7_9MUSC
MVLVSLDKVVIIVIVYEMEHSSVEERTRRSSIYEEYWLVEARFNMTSMEMVTSTSAARTPEHFIPIEKRFNLSNRSALCRRTQELFKHEPASCNKSCDPQIYLNCMASNLTLANGRHPPERHYLQLPRFRDSLQAHR